MFKTFVLVLLLFSFRSLLAEDSIFLFDSWKIPLRQYANGYRFIKSTGGQIEANDFSFSGKKKMTGHYTDTTFSIKEGEFIYYSKEGNIDTSGYYRENKKQGTWKYYFPDKPGKLKKEEEYKDGAYISQKRYTPDGRVLESTEMGWGESLPVYPGGADSLMSYLKNNIQYPKPCRDSSVEGKVIVKFYVDTDGQIKEPVVLKSPNDLLSEEGLRVVRKMPRWIPGFQDGKPVKIYYTLPITFSLKK